MFQIPVRTSTAKAPQATWLNRRATAVTASDAEAAQDRDEHGQYQLAADPDRGRQDVQEQADGVPADGEHPAILGTRQKEELWTSPS